MWGLWITRGETPTLTFEFEQPPDTFDVLHIAFEQKGKIILLKTKDNCIIEGNTMYVILKQEETLLFDSGVKATAQISVKYKDGVVDRSDMIIIGVKDAIEGAI